MQKLIEQLSTILFTGTQSSSLISLDPTEQKNSKLIEMIRSLFGEQLFYKLRELIVKKKWDRKDRKSLLRGKTLKSKSKLWSNPYQALLVDIYQNLNQNSNKAPDLKKKLEEFFAKQKTAGRYSDLNADSEFGSEIDSSEI